MKIFSSVDEIFFVCEQVLNISRFFQMLTKSDFTGMETAEKTDIFASLKDLAICFTFAEL